MLDQEEISVENGSKVADESRRNLFKLTVAGSVASLIALKQNNVVKGWRAFTCCLMRLTLAMKMTLATKRLGYPAAITMCQSCFKICALMPMGCSITTK